MKVRAKVCLPRYTLCLMAISVVSASSLSLYLGGMISAMPEEIIVSFFVIFLVARYKMNAMDKASV